MISNEMLLLLQEMVLLLVLLQGLLVVVWVVMGVVWVEVGLLLDVEWVEAGCGQEGGVRGEGGWRVGGLATGTATNCEER